MEKLNHARVIKRDLLKKDHPWLKKDLLQGKLVYLYTGHTYGVVSPSGTAVTFIYNEEPFFEVPTDALSLA